MYICECVYVFYMCVGAMRGQERMLDSPRTGVTSGCDPRDVGAENQKLHLLYQGSKSS